MCSARPVFLSYAFACDVWERCTSAGGKQMYCFSEIYCCEPLVLGLLGTFGRLFSTASINRWTISVRNVFAIGGLNTSTFWDSSYRTGYWEFLKSKEQRPRHYAVAGIIKDTFRNGASILEVGCGFAPVFPLLRGANVSYTGLDISREVIQSCHQLHTGSSARFVAGCFESTNLNEVFDAVVASEVLYYYPLTEVSSVTKRLLDHLKPGGVLIVTMNKNPKAWAVWMILAFVARRREKVITMNDRGSRWTVCVFEPLGKA